MDIAEELINGVINLDKKSEVIFYEEYKCRIRAFILNKYFDYDDVEDDVSEILAKLFKNMSKYDANVGSFDSWVFSIVKNYMIDKFRRIKKGGYEISLSDITIQPSAISYLVDYETENYLNYYTDSLSLVDSTLLNMKYVQGFTYEEIGQEFNWSSSTASNKVNHIKSKLKKTMESESE